MGDVGWAMVSWTITSCYVKCIVDVEWILIAFIMVVGGWANVYRDPSV